MYSAVFSSTAGLRCIGFISFTWYLSTGFSKNHNIPNQNKHKWAKKEEMKKTTATHKVEDVRAPSDGRGRRRRRRGGVVMTVEVEELAEEEVELVLGGEDGVAEQDDLADEAHDGVGAAGGGVEDEVGDGEGAVGLQHRPDEADQVAHAVDEAGVLELRRHCRREVRGEGAGRLAPPALLLARRARAAGFIAGGRVRGGDGGHAAILVGRGRDCRRGCMQMRITRVILFLGTPLLKTPC